MCTFFNADVGKTINRVLTTHPLQTVIKLSFVANGSETFHVHCFACWTSPEVILFSGSFHLLQHPGYRVCCLESHTKCSVSAGTWYQRLYFLLVLGNHLLVKTSICRSSRGSAESEMVCFITFNLAECAGQPNAGAHRRCDAGAVFWGSSCLQDWGLLPRWHRPTVRCC